MKLALVSLLFFPFMALADEPIAPPKPVECVLDKYAATSTYLGRLDVQDKNSNGTFQKQFVLKDYPGYLMTVTSFTGRYYDQFVDAIQIQVQDTQAAPRRPFNSLVLVTGVTMVDAFLEFADKPASVRCYVVK